MVNDFWHKSAKIGIPHLHSVRWHFTMDWMIAGWMHALTSPMTSRTSGRNLVNFGPVTPEFCRRVCAGRATRCALPRISSIILRRTDLLGVFRCDDEKRVYRRVCYYTNWAQYRPSFGRFQPQNIPLQLCTHLVYAFASMARNRLTAFEWNDETMPWMRGMCV